MRRIKLDRTKLLGFSPVAPRAVGGAVRSHAMVGSKIPVIPTPVPPPIFPDSVI